MEFYEALTEHYDILFPASGATLDFLDEPLPRQARVLDVACGTGNYALALAERGHAVVGVDVESAMIAKARKKTGGTTAVFHVGDMRCLTDLVSPGFDEVFCIGNSLAHLDSEASVSGVLEDMHDLLLPGGTLVIQVVNFDPLVEKDQASLPPIVRADHAITFLRHYARSEETGRIAFTAELRIETGAPPKRLRNTVELLPILSSTLTRLVAGAGFTSIDTYGDFTVPPHGPNTPATIVRARK